jgi:nucleoside-diphosphate-sugar epimerase
MHVVVAGCGWLGTAIARRLVSQGARVTGVRRDPARAESLRVLGVEPLALDLAAPDAGSRLPRADAFVACQSASAEGLPAYLAAYLDANRTLLAAAVRDGARLVYTGSTGVFGQTGGLDVDEETPPAPASETGEVLADAEAMIVGAAHGGARACVVRLSGLYGPGRTGVVERVRSGRLALGAGEDVWMNFCHQDDAATFVLAALERGEPGAVYHGSDAEPARRGEVVRWIADRIAAVPGRTATAPAGPDRRIRSERTRAVLAVSLAYRSFRDGLVPLVPAAGSGVERRPREETGDRGG